MILEVRHTTTYTYTTPVTLGPHVLRLRPRDDEAQRVLAFDLRITPPPSHREEAVDAVGNAVVRVRFDGTAPALQLHAASRVATRRDPHPLAGRHPAAGLPLPIRYPEALARALAPYLGVGGAGGQAVGMLARNAAKEAGGEAAPFLDALTRRIHRQVRYRARPHGEPLPPAEVLAKGEGACRDLTVLFLDAARAMGFAARFVSGYADAGPAATKRELHAWAEVHVPGAGWCGYDPTAGHAVGARHVAVAAAASNRGAAPVEGSFTSAGALATMAAEVDVRVVEPRG